MIPINSGDLIATHLLQQGQVSRMPKSLSWHTEYQQYEKDSDFSLGSYLPFDLLLHHQSGDVVQC